MAFPFSIPRPDPPALINRTVHYHLLSKEEQQEVDAYQVQAIRFEKCSKRAQVFLNQHHSGV